MIQLSCGKWQAKIVPECGANVISLCFAGDEILRCPESVQVLSKRPCVYGVPILLPANRTKDGLFTYLGKQYRLPVNEIALHNHIHGLINNAPFTVTYQDDACVITQIMNDGRYYPFPFVLTFTDRLAQDGLHRTIRLENTGNLTMPYTMAFHTTFAEPGFFRVPLDRCYVIDDRYIPTGELAAPEGWQQACTEGMSVGGQQLSGFFTSAGNTAQIGNYAMTVSEQFDHWVLYNGSGNDGFLCIEPQCGAVDGLNNGRFLALQPNQTEEFTLSITRTI